MPISSVVAVAVVSLAVVVLAAAAMMMDGMLRVLSIVASLAMVMVTFPLSGQAERPKVLSLFHKHLMNRNLLFGLLYYPCMSHMSCMTLLNFISEST